MLKREKWLEYILIIFFAGYAVLDFIQLVSNINMATDGSLEANLHKLASNLATGLSVVENSVIVFCIIYKRKWTFYVCEILCFLNVIAGIYVMIKHQSIIYGCLNFILSVCVIVYFFKIKNEFYQQKQNNIFGNFICNNCGMLNSSDSDFCVSCGSKLEKKIFCKYCGAEIPYDSNFCIKCGKKLS